MRPSLLKSTLILLLALSVASPAAVELADGFPAAREASTASGRPLAVLVHGSSWNRASRLFAEKIWRTSEFRRGLGTDFVLAEIDVRQQLDETASKAFAEETKGWNPKSVSSFPAIQVYGPDGHLLKTVSGRELRGMASSPASVAAQVDALGRASTERDRLLREISELKEKDRPGELAARIDALNGLPVAPEPEAAKTFAALDPQDRTGWAARLAFGDWEFVRGISGRIEKGESQAALDEVEAMLANQAYTVTQRCLILGAKGMLLDALGREDEAWKAYLEAWRADPEGVNGKAVVRHGYRTVGAALRVGGSPDSPGFGEESLVNLTRGHATLALSSSDPRSDKPADHGSLFDGPMKDFAFHTAEEAGAHAVIDLQAEAGIDRVQILNRSSIQERAEGLTLWLSGDGKEWRQVWQADEVAGEWDLRLAGKDGALPGARYLKLGLPEDRKGILHLRAVNVFGQPSEDGA